MKIRFAWSLGLSVLINIAGLTLAACLVPGAPPDSPAGRDTPVELTWLDRPSAGPPLVSETAARPGQPASQPVPAPDRPPAGSPSPAAPASPAVWDSQADNLPGRPPASDRADAVVGQPSAAVGQPSADTGNSSPPPTLVHRVVPDYPRAARRAGRQGTVVLRLHIAGDGTVDTVMVATSSGFGDLDQAAVAAVGQWRFRPAAPCWSTVPVTFSLSS